MVGILFTILGVSWVISEKHRDGTGKKKSISRAGIFLALLGRLGQAVGLVIAKSALQTGINPLSATFLYMDAAALVIWPAAALIGKLHNPLNLLQAKRRALLYLLGCPFFGPFLGIWLSMCAVKNTNPGVAATLMSLMPIFIIPVERIAYKVKPTFQAMVGTLVAILGVAILFLG